MNRQPYPRVRVIGALALSALLSIVLLVLAAVAFQEARGAVKETALPVALGQAHDAAIAAIARVDAYVEKYQRWPASLENAGFTLAEGGPVERVVLPHAPGKPMTVRLKPPYAAYALDYARVTAAEEEAVWTCAGTPNIPDEALPEACRPELDPDAD